jgi:flagellar hook-basal body complex protein FliE
MMISPISGLGSISSISTVVPSASAPVAPAAGDSGSSFTSVLSNLFSGAVNTIGAGETAAIQGMQGAVPAYKVVESVMSAQRTLQTTLAVRDKLVSAYQDITRMSI